MASVRKENKRIKMGSELDTIEARIDGLFAQCESTLTLLNNLKTTMEGDPSTYDAEDIQEVTDLITKLQEKYSSPSLP